jgi:hypothetical protein
VVEQPVVDLERLHTWRAALERKLAELDARVKPLLAEVEKTRQQLQLVDRLLGLESHSGTDHSAVNGTPSTRPSRLNGSVTEALVSILRQVGQPLHISELKERFLQLGLTIPGRGTESNLLSYIVRDPRFVRVSKGTYLLDLAKARSGAASTQAKRASRHRKRRG